MIKNNIFSVDGKNDFVILISGKRNSGKSLLTLGLLTDEKCLRGVFDKAIIIHPFFSEDETYQNVEFDEIYTNFSQELIQEICDEWKDRKNKDQHLLLILDDCISAEHFNSYKTEDPLSDLAFMGRRRNISLLITTQKFNAVPLNIRCQSDYIFIFRTDNKKERKAIQDEMPIKDDFWEESFKEDYYYIFVNNKSNNISSNKIELK